MMRQDDASTHAYLIFACLPVSWVYKLFVDKHDRREGEDDVPLGSTPSPPSARHPRGRAEAGTLSGGQVSYARSPLPCQQRVHTPEDNASTHACLISECLPVSFDT